MENKQTRIECPNCGIDIDVNKLLYQQLDSQLRKQYQAELSAEKKQLAARENALTQQQQHLEQLEKTQQEQVKLAVQASIQAEREKLLREIREKVDKEQDVRFAELQGELQQKSDQLRAFNKAKADVAKLQREKDELEGKINAAAEQRINEEIGKASEEIHKRVAQKAQLNIKERDNLIEQLKTQLQDAQRKAEQGSMQLQGEVQELAIEDWLRQEHPLDSVEEIKKGARGADCLQIVNTRSRPNCGTIYYESKRAKSFQPAWIEKFRSDLRDKSADVGVLVTEVMPPDMPRMGLKDGIWICTVEEFKSLSAVLRESIVRYSSAVATQENKGDKMEMLYDFLTSDTFRRQIEAIVEGFTQMQQDLDSEKRSMNVIWKKREKQIQKVLTGATSMYGSVKGIAGSAVQSIPMLELPVDDGSSKP